MKKLNLLLILLTILISCKPDHPKEYLTLSGTIDNVKDSVIYLRGYKFNKKIVLQNDNTFNDTLKLPKKGNFLITVGSNRANIFLNNGYDLSVKLAPADNMSLVMEFSGSNELALTNNFIKDILAFIKEMGSPDELFVLEKDDFNEKVDRLGYGVDSIIGSYKKADTSIVNQADKFYEDQIQILKDSYDVQHDVYVKLKKAKEKISVGMPSPEFKDYENYKGGRNSLSDYRGTYVYIDLWATWCKPCIAQFPALKKLEEEYKDKNITFISISTNEERRYKTWENARKKWREDVKKYELNDVQLFAGEYQFSIDYMANTIPRFILLDPDGKIIDSNAPRPGDPRLKELFNKLNI